MNGIDGFSFSIFVHEVNSQPVSLSLCISAWFVLFEPFPAFFLPMPFVVCRSSNIYCSGWHSFRRLSLLVYLIRILLDRFLGLMRIPLYLGCLIDLFWATLLVN
jgi:hypothetical protein